MIKISKNAATRILASAKDSDMEGMALRLAVKKDGNKAFEYGMGFDKTTDDDVQVQENGVTIIFSPAFMDLLKDMTIDYVEVEENKPQFIFMNPNDPNYIPPEK